MIIHKLYTGKTSTQKKSPQAKLELKCRQRQYDDNSLGGLRQDFAKNISLFLFHEIVFV